MIRCGACHGVIGSAEDPHWFGGDLRYHPGCCPACCRLIPALAALEADR